MWWECCECGEHVCREHRPLRCSECGTAGVSYTRVGSEDVRFDHGDDDPRLAWLDVGLRWTPPRIWPASAH
jgi:hypothetical protein